MVESVRIQLFSSIGSLQPMVLVLHLCFLLFSVFVYMCSGHEVSFVCGPIRLRSGTDSEAASALDEESGGAAIVSLEEAQKIHQKNGRLDQTMCTVGRWTYWIIVTIIERFAKPAMCVICGHDSRTPSPFHRSHKTDQFGGCWPWRYRMDKRQLLRIVTGSRCAICATCYDVRGPPLGVSHE